MMPGLSGWTHTQQERSEQRRLERHPLDKIIEDIEFFRRKLNESGENFALSDIVGLTVAGRIMNLESAVRGPKK